MKKMSILAILCLLMASVGFAQHSSQETYGQASLLPMVTGYQIGGAYFYYYPDGTNSRIRVYAMDNVKTFECDYEFLGSQVKLTRKMYDSPHAWNQGIYHNEGLGTDSTCTLKLDNGFEWHVAYTAQNAIQQAFYQSMSAHTGTHDLTVKAVADDLVGNSQAYQVNGKAKFI